MNGVHDMGGMHGFGPIVREEHEPRFHADWEAHVFAIIDATDAYFNLDEFRHGIERMDPAHYLRSSYYERWLATVELNLVEKGYLSTGDVDARMEQLRQQPNLQPTVPEPIVTKPTPDATPWPNQEPRFSMGDVIVTRNVHPVGHTRLPRYARGRRGVIHQVHGSQIFPDSHAHGRGEDPKILYNVRFDGQELWGESAEPNQAVYLDLWEPYLEPVPTQG